MEPCSCHSVDFLIGKKVMVIEPDAEESLHIKGDSFPANL